MAYLDPDRHLRQDMRLHGLTLDDFVIADANTVYQIKGVGAYGFVVRAKLKPDHETAANILSKIGVPAGADLAIKYCYFKDAQTIETAPRTTQLLSKLAQDIKVMSYLMQRDKEPHENVQRLYGWFKVDFDSQLVWFSEEAKKQFPSSSTNPPLCAPPQSKGTAICLLMDYYTYVLRDARATPGRSFMHTVAVPQAYLPSLFKQILRALKFLREHNVAHLDLKADNIAVVKVSDGRDGGTEYRAVLIDFGLARIFQDSSMIRELPAIQGGLSGQGEQFGNDRVLPPSFQGSFTLHMPGLASLVPRDAKYSKLVVRSGSSMLASIATKRTSNRQCQDADLASVMLLWSDLIQTHLASRLSLRSLDLASKGCPTDHILLPVEDFTIFFEQGSVLQDGFGETFSAYSNRFGKCSVLTDFILDEPDLYGSVHNFAAYIEQRLPREMLWQNVPRHPNILPLLAVHRGTIEVFGEEMKDVSKYFFIPAVQDSLSRFFERRGTLSTLSMVRVLLQVARGLKHLHSHSIAHRNVSLKSVYLLLNEEDPVSFSAAGPDDQAELTVALGSMLCVYFDCVTPRELVVDGDPVCWAA
jgi:serine/threonine protein kinase